MTAATPEGASRPTASKLRAALDAKAQALGFSSLAVTRPDAIPQAPARLRQFLDAGFHGSMAWMAETEARRADPRVLWPEVRSILILTMNYGPDRDPLTHLADPTVAGISVYARHRDYHDVIKGKLKELASFLVSRSGGDVKVFVDTAPVMEKPLAAAAGTGWQGKHTNLVSRQLGSWFFLGSIFTTAELEPDTPETDHCGSCKACLTACPTDAFPEAYRLDARRCLSYLTIEHDGPIPEEFRQPMGNRIYGCDDCLAACPWNKFAQVAQEAKLQARADLVDPPLADLLKLDDAAFRQMFSGSPIKRIGRDRFLRNCLVAAGNSGDGSLIPDILRLASDAVPMVRGAAAWALSRLLPAAELNAVRQRLAAAETDDDVRAEWQATLTAAQEVIRH
ncbi:MAG: tRNA epoxyqueuosine(34) reductase QueG [Pannonibacter sp.]